MIASGAPLPDPREDRAKALNSIATAQHQLGVALGFLRCSDAGSRVVTQLLQIKDEIEELTRTLEWRQQREATP